MDCLFVVDTAGNKSKGKKSNLLYSVELDALDKIKESSKVEVVGDDDEESEEIVEFDENSEEYIITSKS